MNFLHEPAVLSSIIGLWTAINIFLLKKLVEAVAPDKEEHRKMQADIQTLKEAKAVTDVRLEAIMAKLEEIDHKLDRMQK